MHILRSLGSRDAVDRANGRHESNLDLQTPLKHVQIWVSRVTIETFSLHSSAKKKKTLTSNAPCIHFLPEKNQYDTIIDLGERRLAFPVSCFPENAKIGEVFLYHAVSMKNSSWYFWGLLTHHYVAPRGKNLCTIDRPCVKKVEKGDVMQEYYVVIEIYMCVLPLPGIYGNKNRVSQCVMPFAHVYLMIVNLFMFTTRMISVCVCMPHIHIKLRNSFCLIAKNVSCAKKTALRNSMSLLCIFSGVLNFNQTSPFAIGLILDMIVFYWPCGVLWFIHYIKFIYNGIGLWIRTHTDLIFDHWQLQDLRQNEARLQKNKLHKARAAIWYSDLNLGDWPWNT